MWRAGLLAVAAATPLQKVLFSDEVVNDYSARCLDGSPAGYYVRESPGSKDWVIFLQGGGLCIEAIDCLDRAKSNLGSSKGWGATHEDTNNVLNSDPTKNPFANFNAVYVPYCSGDTYMGIKKEKNLYLGGLYTNGHLILEAIFDHLHNTTSMQNGVGQMLFSGGSAGGIGVVHNADWLTRTITQKYGFKDAVVKGSPQAGLFFPSRPDVGLCLYEEFWALGENCPRIDIFESWYVRHEEYAFVDENCAKDLGDSTRCWDAGIVSRYVKTPLFFAQNRYDQNQIANEFLCLGCTADRKKATAKQQGYLAYFGARTEATLKDLAENFSHSVFMPNCYEHTNNICMSAGPSIGGKSYNSTLSDWFFNNKHIAVYDDCGDFPCSQVCDCHSHSTSTESIVV